MLHEIIKGNIHIVRQIENWQKGIETAAQPLLQKGYITEPYIKAMQDSVLENGPYMVVMPGVAIPHARPECGVMKTGMSVLVIQEGVLFPENNLIQLMIVLAAADDETHLDVIAELTDVFMEDEVMERLFAAGSEEEVLDCF